MRVRPLIVAFVLTAWATPASPAAAQEAPAGAPPPARHVVLVDWDGFDPDFLGRANLPNLRALAARGSLSTGTSTFQTVSNPARASMSTGAYPEVHNNAAYYFDSVSGTAKGQERFLGAETIAQDLAAHGRTLASVQWYMVQNYGATYGDGEHLYVQPSGTFGQRVDVAIDILNRRPVSSNGVPVSVPRIPDFLAVYTDQPDTLAHQKGAESPDLVPLLEQMDADLGRLVQATRDVGIYDSTAFILTADHGMTSWSQTLIPQVLSAITAAGYAPEVVTSGNRPADATEVIIQPGAVRYGDVTLRGRAATAEGRARVRAALESLSPTFISGVLDDADLDALRASDKLGDLIAEANPPYAFSLTVPPPGESRAGHGSRAEMAVPFLVAGPGFVPGMAPADPRSVDVAPTIAHLLGIRPPAQAQGRSLVTAADVGPPPVIPESPAAMLLPSIALVLFGASVILTRRRRWASPINA